jgi:hypothetical protein
MFRLTAPLLTACAAMLAFAAPALGASKPPAPKAYAQEASPAGPLIKLGKARSAAAPAELLWATVNICDTFDSPDAMGLRASMPGNGREQRMYMRFAAQWYSGIRQAWVDVPRGVSPWLYAGSAKYVSRQLGWTFDFVTPSYGKAYILRGTVEYQWRARKKAKGARRSSWKVAKSGAQFTRTGVKGVDGGDPKGTSKAMCAIANVG